MKENPYSPPQSDLEAPPSYLRVVKRLRRPAVGMILVAIVAIGFEIIDLVKLVFLPTQPRLFEINLAGLGLLLCFHTFQVVCAVQMLTVGSYRFAYIGAITCCIPWLSPLLILGIPFGVWAVWVLVHPETKLVFFCRFEGAKR